MVVGRVGLILPHVMVIRKMGEAFHKQAYQSLMGPEFGSRVLPGQVQCSHQQIPLLECRVESRAMPW